MKRPNSKVNLDAAILRLAGTKTQGLRFSAIRAVIADVVIGQMLPDCVIKGGSSLKLRYGLFAYRKCQAWPPEVIKGDGWEEQYIAQKYDLPVLPTVDEAVTWVNDLIRRIATIRS